MELVDQRADVSWLRIEYSASERRVCGLMTMAVSGYRYQTTRSDEPLRTRLVELAREKPGFGYRRLQPKDFVVCSSERKLGAGQGQETCNTSGRSWKRTERSEGVKVTV